MKRIKLFENFSLNKGPFLVMGHDIPRGESFPIRIFEDFKEAEDYLLSNTLADIKTYSSIDKWLDEKSSGEINSLGDFLSMDPNSSLFDSDFFYSYEILNNSSSFGGMDHICTEFEILQEHYLQSLTPEERREYEAIGRVKRKVI